jgi:hypothetical protein
VSWLGLAPGSTLRSGWRAVGRSRVGIRSGRQLASCVAWPHGGCASSGRQGMGVVRAVLAAPCGQKSSGGVGLGGDAGQATRRGREAQRGPLGHGGGRGVLGL